MKSALKVKVKQITLLYERIGELKCKLAKSEVENDQLKDWIERLLKYTELDLKDVKAACEKDKEMASAFKMITGFSRMFG